jgi:signal transduction histidine kinase
MVGGILQDRMVRSEFHMRRLAEERHVALETTVAEVARVNSKLTAEIDARNKLEEQLRQRAAELRDANARLQIEVAEHKVTAAKMERFMAELKRSNDELQQFANVVSHDLRAPLSTISGFVELLGLRLTALDVRDAEAEEYARRTTNGVRRMYGMIEALLGYARLESKAGTPRAVNLNAVFEEVLLNLGADIEASRAVVLVPPLPEVWADPNHMVQLFQNLIGNAIKYAREGARPQIEVSCCSDGEWNRFAVKDNGIGFSPEHAERIFGIFFRIDPHGGRDGVGIGLAICKKIVDRLGGRIWAESVVGAGSTFFVNLPVLRLRAPGA